MGPGGGGAPPGPRARGGAGAGGGAGRGARKFLEGGWIVVGLIGLFILTFLGIKSHYTDVARQLSLEDYEGPPPIRHTVMVLIGDLHRGVVEALQYAKTLSPDAKAIYVELDPERTGRLEEKWGK